MKMDTCALEVKHECVFCLRLHKKSFHVKPHERSFCQLGMLKNIKFNFQKVRYMAIIEILIFTETFYSWFLVFFIFSFIICCLEASLDKPIRMNQYSETFSCKIYCFLILIIDVRPHMFYCYYVINVL